MNQNSIIAYVDNRPITETDVEFLLHTIGPERAKQFDNEAGKQQLIDELVNQELFYSDAIEHGLHETASFMKELERMTVNLVKQFSIRAFLDGVELSDDELRAVYNENPKQFEKEAQVKASHILVSTEEEAVSIRAEIVDGLSFAEAALKYSSCPSKEQGGDLSYFSKGQMVPEFELACFNSEVGDLTEPVKTQFGYHIIEVTDKKESGVRAFEEVREPLYKQVVIQKQNKLFYERVQELKNKYEVKIVE